MMMEFLEQLEWVAWMDSRQQNKVRHKLKDILVIVLFATFADADDWVKIGIFARIHEAYLRKYVALENGVPSHDTIQRALAMMSPEFLQRIQAQFQETLNRENGEKPSHIVSAWNGDDGFCLGQTAVSNEITAIPSEHS